MLRRLSVKNYAIIQDLSIDLDKGLIILTGETGSGKSILLGALGLIMGDRADTKVVFDENEKCIVEAHIDISHYDLKDFFENKDLDYESTTILRREINPGGKTRAFVNDTPVNLNVLQQLTELLIDLHRQFDTLSISSEEFQRNLLDALAGNQSQLEEYTGLYHTLLKSQKELQILKDKEAKALKEQEFLTFQWNELHEAGLTVDEKKELEEEVGLLSNAEEIKKQTGMCFHLLDESEVSIVSQLKTCLMNLSAFTQVHPSFQALYDRLDSTQIELEDISIELGRIHEQTDYDPERLSEANQRLDLIYKLEKKHQVETVEALLTIQDEFQQQLRSYENLSEEIANLEKQLSVLETKIKTLAEEIRSNRLKVIPDIESGVQQRLSKLNMEHATLKVEMLELPEPGPFGMDKVKYLFAANRGSAYHSIKEVASGGEMSRLALCIKSIVGHAQALPTMIFDEIDTGVSGQVAQQMGNMLAGLSENHQVIVITHTPQVAARAHQHFLVYKEEKPSRTYTHIKQIEGEERIQTIATMLSTDPPTTAAVENAKELISIKTINRY